MDKFIKYILIDYHIILQNNTIRFQPFFDNINTKNGFNFYKWEGNNITVFLHTSSINYIKIEAFLLLLDERPSEVILSTYDYIKEVFQIYVWDKQNMELFTLVDYLGIGTNYYVSEQNRIIFFSNFLNIKKSDIRLKLNIQLFYYYLAFGYQVFPFKLPYENINIFKGGILKVFKKEKILDFKIELCTTNFDEIKLAEYITDTYKTDSLENKLFFGATAGKDSLTLISLVAETNNYIMGNFGETLSADVLQGEKISQTMNLPYRHIENCNKSEFKKYSAKIAEISGGMATSSYVDMLKFVDVCIPEGYNFIMGEGGECVREFFDNSVTSFDKALDNYITPFEFLNQCLNYKIENVESYKTYLIQIINDTYGSENIKKSLLKFYRFGRMPGNFSNRTKLLNRYRNKVSPFLNIDFIKNSYHINEVNFQNNQLHRNLIKESSRKENLQFFDKPINSSIEEQNWKTRFGDKIGQEILNIFYNMSYKSEQIFNKESLINFTKKQIENPDRGLYFILRLVSFILYIDKNNEQIILINSKNKNG